MNWARIAIAIANAVGAVARLFACKKSAPKETKKENPFLPETEKLNKKAEEILKDKGGVVRVLTVAPNEEPTIPRGRIPDSPYEGKP